MNVEFHMLEIVIKQQYSVSLQCHHPETAAILRCPYILNDTQNA